uniref:hypothetical protein n=1 Tax=Pseudomonas syringae group genomosp. 7 TaxID=251699 RepID=UPI003770286C
MAFDSLRDHHASAIAKSLEDSTLAQAITGKQTSAEMEAKAGGVLQSEKFSEETKTLAGSVVSLANKARGE